MSKSFIYKGRECVRQLICFSTGTTVYEVDKDAPILGVNSELSHEDAFRQLNAEIQSNVIDGLVKFWTSSPDLKFRYMFTSFQKFVTKNSDKFSKDETFRSSIINLFVALFQQILIEISPLILEKKPISSILRVSNIGNSSDLIKALKKFDAPYQKSLISQDSMGFVNKNISSQSAEQYKVVVEELIKLLTINVSMP